MNDHSQQAIKVFKALSDPVRYKIIKLLIEKGELGCTNIAAVFDISAPAMSHHYRILEYSGLVSNRKSGQHVYLSLNKIVLDTFIPEFKKAHIQKQK